ncbi:MAG: hypothetical protein ABIG89_05235 [Candidatus Woesearchaeota archaeon]
MENDQKAYITNIDAWIKQIRKEYSHMRDIDLTVSENTDNIEFNYELIHELREEIDSLKKELSMIKIMQLISMKPHLKQEIRNLT